MKTRPQDGLQIDVRAFCRDGRTAQGVWSQAALGRLSDSAAAGAGADAPPAVHWSATGTLRALDGGPPQPWLHLEAHTDIRLDCQRCLQPLTETLRIARWFRFVADEAEAERLDEDADEDVLALPTRLDMQQLVEDELILALPIVPRHADCTVPESGPERPAAASIDQDALLEEPHPFAALAALRRPND